MKNRKNSNIKSNGGLKICRVVLLKTLRMLPIYLVGIILLSVWLLTLKFIFPILCIPVWVSLFLILLSVSLKYCTYHRLFIYYGLFLETIIWFPALCSFTFLLLYTLIYFILLIYGLIYKNSSKLPT